jgi:hypothetical protein
MYSVTSSSISESRNRALLPQLGALSKIGKIITTGRTYFDDVYNAWTPRARDGYLVGFMGLTGICCGYALHCAEEVERWIRSGKCALGEKIQLPTTPTSRVQHLEKVLIQAVMKTLRRGEDWEEILRDTHRPLVDRIQIQYRTLIQQMTGGKVVQRIPETDFAPIEDIESVFAGLGKSELKDHYLMVQTGPDKNIYSWHVVYFHPKTGTYGNSCTYGTSNEDQSVFLKRLAGELNTSCREFFLYRVNFDKIPNQSLLYQRVVSRVSTLFNMALYSPSLAAKFALSYVKPAYNGEDETISGKILSEFHKKLADHLKSGDFDSFIKCIEDKGYWVPKGSENMRLKIEPSDVLEGKYAPLLNRLSELGPEAQPVSSWILQRMFHVLQQQLLRETYYPSIEKNSFLLHRGRSLSIGDFPDPIIPSDRLTIPSEILNQYRKAVHTILQFREKLQTKFEIKNDWIHPFVLIESCHPILEEFANVNVGKGYCDCTWKNSLEQDVETAQLLKGLFKIK